MSSSEFRLPDRPIKVDPKALSRPAGTLIGAIVIGALLLFMGYWQLPALIQDTQIRQNPLVVYDSDVRNGECTSRQAIFVDCEADLVYSYNGVHYEKSVSLFFIDFHTGSYDVDVVISRDKPELATISIALDKYWNRVLLLGAFLIGFGIMVVMAIVSAAKVARARKVLAQPGRLTLTPVAITGVNRVRSQSQVTYAIGPKGKSTANSLFPKGTDPLLVLDDHGNAFGYAVEHEGSPIPVLLDRRLERLDLTPEERRTALMALDAEEAAQIEAEGERRNLGASILGGIWTFVKRLIVLAIVVVLGALGYWLYYVTSGTNAFDKIGMEINNMVPAAMNEWGCGKLQERFGDTRAPWGCTGADFQSWK